MVKEKTRHRSKRKRRETVCKDKRRDYWHCGICGGGNVASQGIIFCLKCGAEKEFIEIEPIVNFYCAARKSYGIRPCGCIDTNIGGFYRILESGTYYNQPYDAYAVKVCLDCGAIGAKTCPACRGMCWTSKTGAKFCQTCGLKTKGHAEVEF